MEEISTRKYAAAITVSFIDCYCGVFISFPLNILAVGIVRLV